MGTHPLQDLFPITNLTIDLNSYNYKGCLKMTEFSEEDISRIIEMAWEDRTPFEAITHTFGITEQQVIQLMRREMKPGSFKLWRDRVSGRKTKHLKLRSSDVKRGYCPTQYKHK